MVPRGITVGSGDVRMYRVLSILFWLLALIAFFPVLDASGAAIGGAPAGKGSLPARLFPKGTVCLVDEERPSMCSKALVRIPRRVMKARSVTFYGVFDIDGDGSPEVFLDYWPPLDKRNGDNVVLLVYKEVRGRYRQHLRLEAESRGYAPGAWFLSEAPCPKAIFRTRYGGSSGEGLFHLNTRKRSLDLISGPVLLEGEPEFVDIDGDGVAEVFLPGRGRDRTSRPGAAVLRWKDGGYEMWWPDWKGAPTVIYAALADVDRDGKKDIVAVLEPEAADSERHAEEKTPVSRQLAVWKVTAAGITLLSKARLPGARYLSEPALRSVPPFSPGVELDYVRTVRCTIKDGEITCGEGK